MATAPASAPKAPKRILPANLGKTANTASKILAALASPSAVKFLGILSTGEAGTAELEKLIAPSETLIVDLAASLIKAKLVAKVKTGKGGTASYVLTDLGAKAWAAVQSLAC
jgi:hypothetical protein